MTQLILYGLNDAGDAAFTRSLIDDDRPRLKEIAREGLADWPRVEVWDGPMCVVRMRRASAGA